MMEKKILSYNINGIRAAMKKGLVEWLKGIEADIICLQEVKAMEDQVDLDAFREIGYEHIYWNPAIKKGYSGVAILSKFPADQIVTGMSMEKYDTEGRLLRFDLDSFSLLNTYMPSGTTGDIRQDFKYAWLDDFYGYIHELIKERKHLIICGDFNICHHPIDIHNPVSNKNSSGFLPAERAWVSKFLESGFVDAFRHFEQGPHHYTWWSYRANARQKNLGWRIDYFVVTKTLEGNLINCRILNDAMHSDHCPVELTFDFGKVPVG